MATAISATSACHALGTVINLLALRAPVTRVRNHAKEAATAPNAKLICVAVGKAAPNVPITNTVSSHATGLKNDMASNVARLLPRTHRMRWVADQ